MPTSTPKIEELIHSIESLKLVVAAASSDELVDPKPLFYSINRYDAVPFARVLLGAALPKKKKWLENCLECVDFNNKCYLFAVNFGTGWHWSEVEATNPQEWILALLLRDDVDDFMVLSHDQKGFLGLIEDEAEYLAFVFEDIGKQLVPNNSG